ncbi:ABC transporter ATP-binding protein [Salipiger pacificus]|nr:ABC transporter ATP-binding protein [Alloyangia pacifica]
MTDQNILSLKDVVRDFDGLRAVGGKDGLTFDVSAGKILGLIGPNGAGKSTTFNLISGVLKPTSGSVRFNGTDLAGLRPSDIASLGLARTFQTPRAFASLSVLDNVLVGLAHSREGLLPGILGTWQRQDAEVREQALHWLDRLGLAGLRDQDVTNLSGGELRMLEIARQLARGPRALLLDEPTAGLDSTFQKRLLSILQDCHAEGMTLVIVEHNLPFILELAQDMLVLQNGALLARGTPEDIRRDPIVIKAYLGDEHEA